MAATSWNVGGERRPRRVPRAIGDPPLLERLAQRLERVAPELRQLVEEEHAVVRERDLAGPDRVAAADQRGVGDRVVRGAERARRDERAPVEQAGDAVDAR